VIGLDSAGERNPDRLCKSTLAPIGLPEQTASGHDRCIARRLLSLVCRPRTIHSRNIGRRSATPQVTERILMLGGWLLLIDNLFD
jgi:hypothetical protein